MRTVPAEFRVAAAAHCDARVAYSSLTSWCSTSPPAALMHGPRQFLALLFDLQAPWHGSFSSVLVWESPRVAHAWRDEGWPHRGSDHGNDPEQPSIHYRGLLASRPCSAGAPRQFAIIARSFSGIVRGLSHRQARVVTVCSATARLLTASPRRCSVRVHAGLYLPGVGSMTRAELRGIRSELVFLRRRQRR